MKSKIDRCRYCYKKIETDNVKTYCVCDSWEPKDIKLINEEICENCESFDSRYIEYPLTIQGITNQNIEHRSGMHKVGSLCEIQPCGNEYEKKSFLGIYLGELPISIQTTFDKRSGMLTNFTVSNPAIFVPELKKIIYGMESWWRIIEKPEDFRGISEEDIENTWYVKLLRDMEKKEKEK